MEIILNDSRKEYISRINMVQDYIEAHLDEELKIKDIAAIASFSEFHFQRIYRVMTGESLYSYIKRLRLEKAVFFLRTNKRLSIQEIAFKVGFSNQASLAKAIKERYGVSSSIIRRMSDSEMLQLLSRNGKVLEDNKIYNIPIGLNIKTVGPIDLLYLRYTGSYKGDSNLFAELFTKLFEYATKRNLISEDTKWFTLYHDFGELTDDSKLRLSVSMSVENNIKASGEFGVMELSKGKYAVGEFLINSHEYQGAWNYMFLKWLPESGYFPDDKPCFEHYPSEDIDEEGRRIVEIFIPVISI